VSPAVDSPAAAVVPASTPTLNAGAVACGHGGSM
jgi:hypothetical protein